MHILHTVQDCALSVLKVVIKWEIVIGVGW